MDKRMGLTSPEESEPFQIMLEMQRELRDEWLKVDRIVQHRSVPSSDPGSLPTVEYLVKWRKLQYDECTWEPEEYLTHAQPKIQRYNERIKALAPKPFISPSNRPMIPWDTKCKWLAGELRDYQVEGVNWLIKGWCNNRNVILADEMGLGKTVQTICFLGYLQFIHQIRGPFLVVAPLSTLDNWEAEFEKWVPLLDVVVYTGRARSREEIRSNEFIVEKEGKYAPKFDVLLTTYEMILKDKNLLGAIQWNFVAVDEAHRLKNCESALHEALKEFCAANKLLITGTPVQNNLRELWSLLHFLDPTKFWSLPEFEKKYSDLSEQNRVSELHALLKLHLLRRVKKDVEKSLPAKNERILRVPLSALQKKYYKCILAKNFEDLRRNNNKGARGPLINIVMELKKNCNHPYLFERPEHDNPTELAGIIKNSGKMVILDKLLVRLKETNHRVLIFSQMVRMLDILNDYLKLKGFLFQRLDGSMSRKDRQIAMESFNSPNSKDFCFLLSTRAGGLGINLATADTVIIFDSDWNPQNDLQAEARAHRIGQKNTVNIYRLITKDTVEEDILERAKKKMVLDHLVIQKLTEKGLKTQSSEIFNRNEFAAILQFGAEKLFKETEEGKEQSLDDLDIDEILKRAEVPDTENDLLNAYRVNSFALEEDEDEEIELDDSFWDKVISVEDRKKEEIKDENNDSLPRRKRKVRSYAELASKGLDYEGNAKRRKGNDTTKKTLISGIFFDGDFDMDNEGFIPSDVNEELPGAPLKLKEMRRLVSSVMNFGSLNRLPEIVANANIPNVNALTIHSIASDIIHQARKASSSRPNFRRVLVKLHGLMINASALVRRMDELEAIRQAISGLVDYSQYSINANIREWEDYLPVWRTPQDDAMLLVGIVLHGWGQWEKIRLDSRLKLENKISPTMSTAVMPSALPSGDCLNERAEFLLKAIRRMNNKRRTRKHYSDEYDEDDEDDDSEDDEDEEELTCVYEGDNVPTAMRTSQTNPEVVQGHSLPATVYYLPTPSQLQQQPNQAPQIPPPMQMHLQPQPHNIQPQGQPQFQQQDLTPQVEGSPTQGNLAPPIQPVPQAKAVNIVDPTMYSNPNEIQLLYSPISSYDPVLVQACQTALEMIKPKIENVKGGLLNHQDENSIIQLNKQLIMILGNRIQELIEVNQGNTVVACCLWKVAASEFTCKSAIEIKSLYYHLKHQN
eukprot:TRINITY_DN5241_c0_g1_i1.p1 TRINITY_DN5241_c0_g1~~TRINITY_DN5241_c0_g1_i1.p1  ORF type:complete len:1373 (+),score=407.42 TRINITY_DN5241_c0_g1_i1:532-4119(+)